MSNLSVAIRTQKILLVDNSVFHRSLVSETLRSIGATHIEGADDVPDALEKLRLISPTIVITDWMMEPIDGIAFTRLIRAGDTAMKRDVAIIMATGRTTAEDVETARRAGVDEFVVKPFTTQAMVARLHEVLFNRRPFVAGATYIGPCRRRRFLMDYEGPKRRLFDEETDSRDSPEVVLKRALAKARLTDIRDAMKGLTPGHREKIRKIYACAKDILQVGVDIQDPLLRAAAESLVKYIEAVGASPRFNIKVLDSHVDVMTQLMQLPDVPEAIRDRVASALGELVRKKLAAPDFAPI